MSVAWGLWDWCQGIAVDPNDPETIYAAMLANADCRTENIGVT